MPAFLFLFTASEPIQFCRKDTYIHEHEHTDTTTAVVAVLSLQVEVSRSSFNWHMFIYWHMFICFWTFVISAVWDGQSDCRMDNFSTTTSCQISNTYVAGCSMTEVMISRRQSLAAVVAVICHKVVFRLVALMPIDLLEIWKPVCGRNIQGWNLHVRIYCVWDEGIHVVSYTYFVVE